MSLAVRPVQLNNIEYRWLWLRFRSTPGGCSTYEHLLRCVWRVEADAYLSPVCAAISSLRRKLGDDGKDLTYNFTQLRVGYRMPKGEGSGQ